MFDRRGRGRHGCSSRPHYAGHEHALMGSHLNEFVLQIIWVPEKPCTMPCQVLRPQRPGLRRRMLRSLAAPSRRSRPPAPPRIGAEMISFCPATASDCMIYSLVNTYRYRYLST